MADNSTSTSNVLLSNIDLQKFRKIVKGYLERHHYIAAEFWANKVISLSGNSPVDIYYLAQCYFHTKQYHRAILLINANQLTKNLTFRYLAARCFFEISEYQAALDVLEQDENSSSDKKNLNIPDIDDLSCTESSIQVLKGNILEAADNRALATECYKSAIITDPFCYEAIHALTRHHMLSLNEEKKLLSTLPLHKSCNDDESQLVEQLYEMKLNKYEGISAKSSQLQCLDTNLDSITSHAERLYYLCDFAHCFKITQRVLQQDPYHIECLPIHIACLVELKQPNTLFLLGHKLVDLYPETALAWFAVGCYYYLINKHDHARRFLSKSTSLDKVFGPAWIAYGHSFAAESEHDQARAAYYKAAQLIKGCHLPLLYIGMEYSLTNNPKYAEKFFSQALDIAPEDPFVHHELGVVAFSNEDYSTAESCFCRAITIVEDNGLTMVPDKWCTLLNNMGHTCRKRGKHHQALHFHQQALRVNSSSGSTYAAIGLVQTLLGDYQTAILSLHEALSLQRDNTVAASLLDKLMEHVIVNSKAFEDDDEQISSELSSLESNCAAIAKLHNSNSSYSGIKDHPASNLDISSMPSLDENNSVKNTSQNNTDSSALVIEDMILDDESP